MLLEPVEWTDDGWLRVRPGSDPAQPIRRPAGEAGPHGLQLADDFRSAMLRMQWQFWGEWDAARVDLTSAGNGGLIMRGKGTSPADCSPMVGVAADHAYEIETEVELNGDVEAGLVLFYSPACYAALALSKDGIRFAIRGQMMHFHIRFPSARARLRIVNDHNELDFWYGEPGLPLCKVAESLDVSCYQHNAFGGFLSLRPGLFCAGGGTARFRRFGYRSLEEAP